MKHILLLLFAGFTTNAYANIHHHAGSWNAFFLQGKVNSSFGWFFEQQLRLHSTHTSSGTLDPQYSRANRILLRGAIRWFPTQDPNLQIHLGYGFTPNLSPERGEDRIYQQFQYQWGSPLDIQWTFRFRSEQRFIENTGSTAHRVRFFQRGIYWLPGFENSGISVWDEIFWNLNTVQGGPNRGYDQNRIFAGPTWKLSPQARLEIGYLNVLYGSTPRFEPVMSHLFGGFLFFDL